MDQFLEDLAIYDLVKKCTVGGVVKSKNNFHKVKKN